jgi:hypothetical protein
MYLNCSEVYVLEKLGLYMMTKSVIGRVLLYYNIKNNKVQPRSNAFYLRALK